MKKNSDHPAFDELTAEPATAQEPGYDAWKEAKVKKALNESKKRSNMIPAHDVWEKFGFER
ncbi:hypothetical protein M8R20_06445 [Pseudomonas sp. R2.Fl]|nr:hypothetical protein [Pseudomonas sp. R2.Fl]